MNRERDDSERESKSREEERERAKLTLYIVKTMNNSVLLGVSYKICLKLYRSFKNSSGYSMTTSQSGKKKINQFATFPSLEG